MISAFIHDLLAVAPSQVLDRFTFLESHTGTFQEELQHPSLCSHTWGPVGWH